MRQFRISVQREVLVAFVASATTLPLLLAGIPAQSSIQAVAIVSSQDDEFVEERPEVDVPQAGIPDEDRVDLLGKAAAASNDVVYTALGGPDGVAILRAGATDGFHWERIASIAVPPIETDGWVVNHCLDPSARTWRSCMALERSRTTRRTSLKARGGALSLTFDEARLLAWVADIP